MHEPYAIRPASYHRKEALAAAKAYKGTESSPQIPDEFRPFIQGSLNTYLGQQTANPIGQYNASNPMDVESMTPWQEVAMGSAAGNLNNSGMDGLAMQAAQRAAGMAGSGPTTGTYDPSGEMGLQDWMQFMDPYYGSGGEVGTQAPMGDAALTSIGGNAPPVGPAPTNYAGGPPQVGGGGASPSPGTQPGAPPPIPGIDGGQGMQQALAGGPTHGATGTRHGRGWQTADPFEGQFQYDQNGMPIGPGGNRYSGNMHEFSGFSGGSPEALAAQERMLGAAGGSGPSQAQWLQEVNRQQVAQSDAQMTPEMQARRQAVIAAQQPAMAQREGQRAEGIRLASGGGGGGQASVANTQAEMARRRAS